MNGWRGTAILRALTNPHPATLPRAVRGCGARWDGMIRDGTDSTRDAQLTPPQRGCGRRDQRGLVAMYMSFLDCPDEGIVLRLSSLDTDAVAALRVIAHFQALLGGDLEAGALVRSTASLAECPAGIELPDGRTLRASPDGHALPGSPARASAAIGLSPTGRVWLERSRCARSPRRPRPGMDGPHRHHSRSPPAARARPAGRRPRPRGTRAVRPRTRGDRAHALRTLGLDPRGELRVTTVTCADSIDPGLAAVALFSRAALPGTQRIARLGPQAVVLHQHRPTTASPAETLRQVLSERAAERTTPRTGAPAAPYAAGQAAHAVRAESAAAHPPCRPAAAGTRHAAPCASPSRHHPRKPSPTTTPWAPSPCSPRYPRHGCTNSPMSGP